MVPASIAAETPDRSGIVERCSASKVRDRIETRLIASTCGSTSKLSTTSSARVAVEEPTKSPWMECAMQVMSLAHSPARAVRSSASVE